MAIDPRLQPSNAPPAGPDTSIPRGPTPSNPYDVAAQRLVREAEGAAQRRDDRPWRERSGPPANPGIAAEAGGQNTRGPRRGGDGRK
jgi:hypothetical protein